MFTKRLALFAAFAVAVLTGGIIGTDTGRQALAQAGIEIGPNAKIVAKILSQGPTPVVSTCGTSAALAVGSTDVAGKITVGTSASNACTLTFSSAWAVAPFCVVQNSLTGAAANVYAVSTTAIVWSSALADSTTLFYHCIGSH